MTPATSSPFAGVAASSARFVEGGSPFMVNDIVQVQPGKLLSVLKPPYALVDAKPAVLATPNRYRVVKCDNLVAQLEVDDPAGADDAEMFFAAFAHLDLIRPAA